MTEPKRPPHSRARNDALSELARRYPEEYRRLYEARCAALGLPVRQNNNAEWAKDV